MRLRRGRTAVTGGATSAGRILAMGLTVVLVVLLIPLSVAAGGFQKVQLVNGSGDPVKAPNGVLDVGDGRGALTVNGVLHPVPRGVPVHLQRKIYGSHLVQVATFPADARFLISSITATGIVSAGGPPGFVSVFSAPAADCSSTGFAHDFAQFNLTSVPTSEFTYPITALVAPVGFTPSGPWCIGVNTSASMSYTFLTMDGSKEQ